jgi:membrane protein implicated in regulation of membrane protease activity
VTGEQRSLSLEEEIFSPRFFRVVALISFIVIVLFAAGHFSLFFLVKRDLPHLITENLNLDSEGNIPTWINSLMLLAVSVAAFLIGWLLKSDRSEKGGNKRERLGWLLTCLMFFYLATDDAAQLHDSLAHTLQNRLGNVLPKNMDDILWYAWIPVFVFLGVLAILVLAPMIRRTLKRDRSASRLIGAGILCFVANPIVEILENMRVDLLPENLRQQGAKTLMSFNPRAWHELQGLIILEESLEMIGATCFLLSFLLLGRKLLEARSDYRASNSVHG